MADDNKRKAGEQDGATPPGGGEQNQETMRRGAMRPISGPGAADFIAASGGLGLPGADPAKGTNELRGDAPRTDARNLVPDFEEPVHEPIPGERDPTNLTGSQTGTIGGGGFGAHNPSADRATGMDDATVQDRENEGGGSPRDRRK